MAQLLEQAPGCAARSRADGGAGLTNRHACRGQRHPSSPETRGERCGGREPGAVLLLAVRGATSSRSWRSPLAVRERGGEVAFLQPAPNIRPRSRQAGVPVFPLQSGPGPLGRGPRRRGGGRGGRRKSIPGRAAARFATGSWRRFRIRSPTCRSVIAEFQPDAIVADASMWGPPLILRGERTDPGGTRVATDLRPRSRARTARLRAVAWRRPTHRAAATRARALESVIDLGARPMRRRVNELRARYGLGPMAGGVNAHLGGLDLYLVLSIPELDFNRWDLPPGVHYVGSCLWHPPQTSREDTWLDEIDRGPAMGCIVTRGHLSLPGPVRAAGGRRRPVRRAV